MDCVDSTNDYLKKFVGDGHPRAVCANRQTSGRGQYGKVWFSPPGEGLYASYLTYPGLSLSESELLHQIASVAVLNTIRGTGGDGLELNIKAPNDVYIGQRKVCGILVEIGSQEQSILWAIIGIGINVAQKVFPPDLSSRATSLLIEGFEIGIDPLQTRLTIEIDKGFGLLSQGLADQVRKAYERFPRLSAAVESTAQLPGGS